MATYNGYHSIDIFMDSANVITGSKKNTWNDFRLVAEKRPSVNPPEPKLEYTDVPGRDGSLDYTNVLSGYTSYNNRTGSWDFIVVNDFYEPVSTHEEWYVTYSKVMAYIQGKMVKVILEDDLEHYYRGRLYVDSFDSGDNYSTLSISYNLEPYKYSIYSTNNADWLWDPFNFYTGVIPMKKYEDINIPCWNRTSSGDWSSRHWVNTVIDASDIGTAACVPRLKGDVNVDMRCAPPWYDNVGGSRIEPNLLFQVPGWSGVRKILQKDIRKGIRIPEYTLRPGSTLEDRTVKCCCGLNKHVPLGFFTEEDMPYHLTECSNCGFSFSALNEDGHYTPFQEQDEEHIDIPYIMCNRCRHKHYFNAMTHCPNCDIPLNRESHSQGKFYTEKLSTHYVIHCRNCNHDYIRPYAPNVGVISIDVRRSDF